jgi:3'(2'), 5'-bisphosphate nucleotidase
VKDLLPELIRAARHAGELLLARFRASDLEVKLKADDSPVTEADLASHRYLSELLEREFGIPVVSEEGELAPPTGKEFFLIDPLDGTRDFVEGNREFSVLIALIRDGVPVMGVIHGPATGETYYAQQGQGAFVERKGETHRLGKPAKVEEVLARSRHHDSPEASLFAVRHGIDKSIVIGSALKFGRLAEGRVALYPRFGESYEWDIAAGHCLIKEVGGHCLKMKDRREPRYGNPGFKLPAFLALAPGLDPADFY